MKIVQKVDQIYKPQNHQLLWGGVGFKPIQSVKLTFELEGGGRIQAAGFQILTHDGKIEFHTCISSQAGCKFGCEFCISGKRGFQRNLTVDEIVSQALFLREELATPSIDHIVYMGIGEPLDNAENVFLSIKKLTGVESTLRTTDVSIATIGLPKGFRALVESRIAFKSVWFSLHSAINRKRQLIIPSAKSFSVEELVNAAEGYARDTSQKVWVNYVLFKDLNSKNDDLLALQKLFHGRHECMRIFITLPNGGISQYEPASIDQVVAFRDSLRAFLPLMRIETFIAAGRDVQAGCGEFIFIPPTKK